MTREEMAALPQGSIEWKAARCGSLGASRVADAMARTQSGWGASRANLMAELLVERLTENPAVGFMNDAMRWGQEQEPFARAAYEFHTDFDVEQVGIVTHPTIKGTHASPDGRVGHDGLIEIKCPQSATHLDVLLGKPIPAKYITQMQWQMACDGRSWVDWISFDPRLPESMRLFVSRVHRDDLKIAELEKEVRAFLAELEQKVSDLTARYPLTGLAA